MHDAIATIATKLKAQPGNIAKWRQRGYVPHNWRLPILQEAQRTGVLIAIPDFMFTPSGKLPAKRRKRKAA